MKVRGHVGHGGGVGGSDNDGISGDGGGALIIMVVPTTYLPCSNI